ncbi:MAG TPA: serine hydrolase [Nocardioides sp.]
MAISVRARLRLLTAVLLLLATACTADPPAQKILPVPGHEELVSTIADFGDPFYDWNELRAVVVATDDDIVFEQYYETDAEAYWGMQSVTKTVISTLVGIALDEGILGGLEDTLADLLPRYADVMSPETAGITLRQLLTMTAGFPAGQEVTGPAFVRSEDWVRHIVRHPELPPGDRFLYSNGTSHLLSAILSEATGVSALEYARSRLFDPLGIDTRPALVNAPRATSFREFNVLYDRADFAWPADPQGLSTGWWGLRLRPRDMVRIGQLFLAGGRWEGEQLVPEDWVEEATTEQVPAEGLSDGYGFQWWTGLADGEHSFQAIGFGGQHIVVVPDRGLVVVVATRLLQSDPSSRGIDNQVLTGMIEHVIVPLFPPM